MKERSARITSWHKDFSFGHVMEEQYINAYLVSLTCLLRKVLL